MRSRRLVWSRIFLAISPAKLPSFSVLSLCLVAYYQRTGVWFKALTNLDRVLIDLVIKVVDRVRSVKLAMSLCTVVRKLEEALENRISRIIKTIGFPLACKIVSLAKKWGNSSAEKWLSDISFARFLAIMHLNSNRAAVYY